MTAVQGNEKIDARDARVTEDEAALYDRQIRLWGLEAQGRIRTAHVLVVNLDGLTTEAIKNWVLAGIHRLTLIDCRSTTQAHDLSAGFFWRYDEDIGRDRLTSAAARIQALNPLVKIQVLSSDALDEILDSASSTLAELQPNVLVVGVPSGPEGMRGRWSKASLSALNEHARSLSISFYCAGTQGLNGWMFSDLGATHEYVIERPEVSAQMPAPIATAATATTSVQPSNESNGASTSTQQMQAGTSKRLEKRRQAFVPLGQALEMSWKGLTRAQLRRHKPSLGYFGVLAAWECASATAENDNKGKSPASPSAAELAEAADRIMEQHGITLASLVGGGGRGGAQEASASANEFFEALAISISQPGEFSPTCAILGGVLSQDVLNAIGGREEPVVNWFQLEGLTGAGPVHALATSPSELITSAT